VLGLLLICPAGIELDRAKRDVPPRTVLRADPELVAGLSPEEAADFTEVAVVQSPEMLRRFREDIAPGIALADEEAMERIHQNWRLSVDPESGPAYERPALILTGRQDWAVGYAEQYTLLPHYPRATFAVLDRAGHNLQMEQPALFGALVWEWLDRVAESAG
jgi:pimeloyl-ACP methyl ester carboxylesterase